MHALSTVLIYGMYLLYVCISVIYFNYKHLYLSSLYMYRHISLKKLHTPYVSMNYEMK